MVKGRENMSNELDKLAEGIGEAIKTVPELYRDAFQPAVQETGDVLALVPRAIKAALLPLRQWIIEREYNLSETVKLLEKELEHVGEDKIVTPEAYVAVPALQAISYSMNSEELRSLYAKLLAKAMNSDTKDLVHPSFVEIIKQMSPLDAKVFKALMEREANPCIDLLYRNNNDGYVIIMTNITDISIAPTQSINLSIDNLVKQNLIVIPDSYYTNDSFYTSILQSEFYMNQERLHPPTPDGFKFTYKKKKIDKTNLGTSFYNMCVLDL